MLKFFLKAWLGITAIGISILMYDSCEQQKIIEYEKSLPKQPKWDSATSPTYQKLMIQRRRFEERHKNDKMRKKKDKPVQDSLTKEQLLQREWIEDMVESEIENKMD